MAVRREAGQSGSRKKKSVRPQTKTPAARPRRTAPSQGHPSQGRPTVSGGTKKYPKTTRYKTPNTAPKGGHPSREGVTVRGGTKKHPRIEAYAPTFKGHREVSSARQYLRILRRQRKQIRLLNSVRGSKASKPTISESERRELHRQAFEGPQHIMGGYDFSHEKELKEGYRYPLTKRESVERKRKYGGMEERNAEAISKTVAPALKALEISTRPSKAVGNIISGQRVDKAVANAAKGEGKFPSEALGITNNVLGFGVDVALDPATYVSGATRIPAREAEKRAAKKVFKQEAKKAAKSVSASKGSVEKAARQARRKALKRGLSAVEATQAAKTARDQAQRAAGQRRVVVQAKRKARRAGRRAGEGVPENKGLTIGVGQNFRTSGKTTAKVVRKVRRGKEAKRTREFGLTLSPHVRPAGVPHAEFEALKAAEREARAGTTRGTFKAVHLARALKDNLPKKDYEQVIDAIERGTVSELRGLLVKGRFKTEANAEGENLYRAAKEIERAFAKARRAEIKAGIETPGRRGYFSHQLREILEAPPKTKGRGGRTIRPYTESRKFQGTLKQIREEGGPDFSTNVPLVLANRLAASAHDVAKANLNRAVLKAGRAITPGKEFRLEEGEAVATIKGSHLSFIDGHAAQQIADGKVLSAPQAKALRKKLSEMRAEYRALERALKRNGSVTPEELEAAAKAVLKSAEHQRATGKFKFGAANEVHAERLAKKYRSTAENLRKVKGGDLSPLKAQIEAVEKKLTHPVVGDVVIVNRGFVNRLVRGAAPGENLVVDNPILRGYDKVQGGFKFAATYVNPGFHFRNLYGDTQNAYLAQAFPSLVANIARSARVLHRLGQQEEALLSLDKQTGKPGTIKVKDEFGRKVDMNVDALAKEAETAGAVRQGFLGRELPELLRGSESRVRRLGHGKSTAWHMRGGRNAKRLIQNREDLMRLATYIGARRSGLTAREAANRVMKHHFDYGDLSPFEREVLRRFFPFYTFTARNIPLQAKSFLLKPGKYANFEKLRQHVGMAFDIDQDEFESRLREYQARGVPFPVEIDGNMFAVSTAFPLQDLNQLPWQVLASPGFASAVDFADESYKKMVSMLTPLLRTPAELYSNYSNFFRGDIERDDSPLVPAPSFVGSFPDAVKDKLGVVKAIDRKSGKKIWMWPGKVDYIAKVVPGPSNFALQFLTDAENRRYQGTKGKLLSYGLGIKADRLDDQTAKIDRLFDEKDRLEKDQAKLRQQGIGSADYGRKETSEWRRNRDRLKAIDERITKLSKQRGDKVPLLESRRRRTSSNPLDLLEESGPSNPLDDLEDEGAGNPLDALD